MENEDFVTIGSALPQCEDDDILSRKPVAVHEQVVRDENGRIRFHGAFTGGFSAGYFNSVDTKEGWAPKHFKSSRSSRNQGGSSQKPEDFMDSEDFGEFGIAPKKLFTSNRYQGTPKTAWKAPHENEFFSLFSNPLLQKCIEPAKITVGQKLLKRLGWRANNITEHDETDDQEDIFGCALPPSFSTKKKAPVLGQSENVCPINFNIQNNQFGMGYKGLAPQPTKLDQNKSAVVKGKGIRGQAFGVGALEDDDDDIYAGDSASNYNTVLYMDDEEEPVISPIKKIADKKQKKVIEGFKKAFNIPLRTKIYQAPEVPKDFSIHKKSVVARIAAGNENEPKHGNSRVNSSFKRGEILGEKPQIGSVFELLSENDRLRIEDAKKTYELSKSSGATIDSKEQSSQIKDEDKVEEKKETKLAEPSDKKDAQENMTEWEKDQKRESTAKASHFSQSVMMGRFTKASMDDDDNTPFQEKEQSAKEKAASEKKFGRLTREVVKWYPAKLLCVRFNVEDPYPDSTIAGLPTQKHSKLSIFDILTQKDWIIKDTQPEVSEQSTSERKTKVTDVKPATHPKPLAILATTDLRPQSNESTSITLIPADSTEDLDNTNKHRGPTKQTITNEPEETETPLPNIDIFKAIFEDDDDEDESDDDEETDDIKDENAITTIPVPDKSSESRHQSPDESAATIQNVSLHDHVTSAECTSSKKKKHKKEKHKHNKKHKHSDKPKKKKKKSKKSRHEKSDESSSDDESPSRSSKVDDEYLLAKLRSIV